MKEKYRLGGSGAVLKMLFLGVSLIFVIFLFLAESGEAEEVRNSEFMEGLLEGLERSFRSPKGLLHTRLDKRTYMSETISLEMELRVRQGCRDVFDEQAGLLEKYFLSPLNLFYWELDGDLHPTVTANASVDDLRACRALIEAHRRWKDPHYLELAKRVGNSILRYNTVGDLLVDGCSWKERSFGRRTVFDSKSYLTLSYADIGTMNLLAVRNRKWFPVVQRSWGVLLAGVRNRMVPRWGYDGEKNAYDDSDDNTINMVMSLNYLAEMDTLPSGPVNLLLDEFRRNGVILCANGEENIAVYALVAMLFQRTGHQEEAGAVISLLKKFRIDSGNAEGLLGYGDGAVWAFDNLLVLIAMEEVFQRPATDL